MYYISSIYLRDINRDIYQSAPQIPAMAGAELRLHLGARNSVQAFKVGGKNPTALAFLALSQVLRWLEAKDKN